MSLPYKIDITMPSGEKLPTYHIDGDVFVTADFREIAARLASDIGIMIEKRIKNAPVS